MLFGWGEGDSVGSLASCLNSELTTLSDEASKAKGSIVLSRGLALWFCKLTLWGVTGIGDPDGGGDSIGCLAGDSLEDGVGVEGADLDGGGQWPGWFQVGRGKLT